MTQHALDAVAELLDLEAIEVNVFRRHVLARDQQLTAIAATTRLPANAQHVTPRLRAVRLYTDFRISVPRVSAAPLDAGLTLESIVSLEGISFALSDFDARMDDYAERALLMDTLRAVEAVPELLGIGPHMLATARPII